MIAQLAFDATWNFGLSIAILSLLVTVVRQWTRQTTQQEAMESRLAQIEKHTEVIPVLDERQRNMKERLDGIDARLGRLERATGGSRQS